MSILSGPWTRQRAKSFFFLAVAFWRRQLRRVVGLGKRDEGGAQRFLDNFASEGMVPLSAQETEGLHRLGACIQCGLCEAMGDGPVDRGPAWSRAIATRRMLGLTGDSTLGIVHCPVGLGQGPEGAKARPGEAS